MGVTDDIFQLTLTGSYQDKTINNVFFYGQLNPNASPTVSSSLALISGFVEDVLPSLNACLSDELTWTNIEAFNLFDFADFASDASFSNNAGLFNGTPVAPFMAYEYRANRARRDVRNGYKRFAGVCEEILDGTFIAPAYFGTFNTAGVALTNTVTYSGAVGTPSFQGCIVKRIRVDTAGVISYRLPVSQAEATVYVAEWSIVRVTTQSSRKPW
jgi:hypothetical protein